MPGPLALDCRQLGLGPSGDRTYLASLLRELFALEPERGYLLCFQNPPDGALDDLDVPPSARLHTLPARPGWLWTQLAWPRLMRREGAALGLAQYLVPSFAPCPTVAVIHDVSFLPHPEWFLPRPRRIMRVLIPLAARRATAIVTGSEHAAGEIVRHIGVPHRKVHVCPYAAGPQYRPADRAEAAACAARYGLEGRFVLAVGLIQPRKNLARLLAAFAALDGRHHDVKLAIVGRTGWQVEAVQAQVAALEVSERVVFCGAVPDEDLPRLYGACAVFCYPSLYEGFGLPPLEAMACGAPVVASGTTSIPEVVGDAGVLVDPLDVGSLAGGLNRVLGDPALAEELGRKGIERAAGFSWRRCAEQHLELFRALGA
ncbi:MAG: glycosyltransferase family 4 protein [Armatimonadetes bacterium]|nr:glycosyltransferase family 4 protein [Armatimonadota bacterium]